MVRDGFNCCMASRTWLSVTVVPILFSIVMIVVSIIIMVMLMGFIKRCGDQLRA